MKRYFATFFRGKWLYLSVLSLMLGASAVGTYQLSHSQYESTARIWVDNPTLNSVLNRDGAPYGKTPAQDQADKLYQLLQTDAFVVGLLKKTMLAEEITGVQDHDRQIFAGVRKSLAVAVFGANTLTITSQGTDRVLCQQLVQSTIDAYRNWTLEVQVEQSSVEMQFYQQQLKIYEDQISDTVRRIEDLQKEYPSSTLTSPTTPQYLELQRLERELEGTRGLYTATKIKIDQTSLIDSISATSRNIQFQVLDKPTVPLLPAIKLSKLVKYFGMGFVASIGLLVTVVVLATWQDTTIRTVDDIRLFSDVSVLKVIPYLPSGSKWRSTIDGRGDSHPHPPGGKTRPTVVRGREGKLAHLANLAMWRVQQDS